MKNKSSQFLKNTYFLKSIFILGVFIFISSCKEGKKEQNTEIEPKSEISIDLEKLISDAESQLEISVPKLTDLTKHPRLIETDSSAWKEVPNGRLMWTSGFYPGILWHTYDATGNVPDSVWQFRSSGVSAKDIEFTRFDTKVLMHLDMDDAAIGIGTTTPSSVLDVDGDIETGATDAFYFGDPTTDGTWRIRRDGDDLSFERLESGTWEFKMKINP